ncbi:MAG TPA: extracellular solute-binding protein [Candidatus Acidoferrales bacterium]|nr:extracellular solute-binding protein [Candidatus Acidoferrales bacterium]
MDKRSAILSLAIALALSGLPCARTALAQSPKERVMLSKAQIMEGAKKEGKLTVSPAFDEKSIPVLVKAFEKKYPFIKVSWTSADGIPAYQRQLFELSSGRAHLDVFSTNIAFWSEYFKQNVVKNVDFRGMAQAGHLSIHPEMVDDSGMVVWLGSYTGVLVYNTKLVPPDRAPKSWEACLDPYFKGKFSVDTKPNVLAWLTPAWGEEKLLALARRIKDNNPLWSRGNTRNLTLLGSGEVLMNCGNYVHSTQRAIKQDPNLKMVVPDPFPMSFHEPEAIYAGAKNVHSALLWIEFLASREGQELAESLEPGRASFLVEGTLAHRLKKGANVSLCGNDCRGTEDKIMERIATQAWGFPKVGFEPKK